MEERRFDAWTRSLGAATSRRQVLKGVLGGVVALVAGRAVEPELAEAAEVCDRHACANRAKDLLRQCEANCHNAFHRHEYHRSEGLACTLACAVGFEEEVRNCRHNATGCFGQQVCCGGTCASLDNDPNNCGACGHACPNGHACVDGQCQCDADQTKCGDQCVDTETDNTNCGACGNVCNSCETCQGGECQPLNCASGQTCCQHLCIPECQGGPPDPNTCLCDQCDGQSNGLSCGPNQVCCDQHCMSETCPEDKTFDLNSCACQCTPVECPEGQTQDPVTCQCVSICLTSPDGTDCGTDEECCQQQCVSTVCPAGRTFNSATCQCECTSIQCPSGESQNPLTCQCEDLCASVTCGTCQTCDPSSGQCVNVDNNTDCGGGNVCCNGTCQADCTCSTMTCQNDCCPSTDYYCCEANDGCCPQVTLGNGDSGAFCLAPGPASGDNVGFPGLTIGGCCQPENLMKLSVIDPTTNQCACDQPDGAYGIFCDGNMPYTYSGSPACNCGHWLS